MIVDVIPCPEPTENLRYMCDKCGTGILADGNGHWPLKCPGCGNYLNYRETDVMAHVRSN